MFSIIKRLWNWKREEQIETTNQQHESLKCPDCGGVQFYDGPEGGMCRNICCATESCNSAFNYGGWGKIEDNRIDNFYWFAEDDHRRKSAEGERPVKDVVSVIDRRAAIRATKDKHE